MVGKKGSDFNPDELAQKTNKHEQDISKLYEWAIVMEQNFGDNEKIAVTLLRCSQESVKFRSMFSEVLVAQIKTDQSLRDTLNEFIDQSDRNAFRRFVKQVGMGVWTLIVSLVSGTIVYFLLK